MGPGAASAPAEGPKDRADAGQQDQAGQHIEDRIAALDGLAGRAACGELIYDILKELGPVTAHMAAPLYVAIATDTGCFQYSSTTAATHRTAAALMDTGLDVFPLNKKHFRTKTWPRLQVERLIVERMHRYDGGKIAVAPVSLSLMEEAGAVEGDMEDIAAFLGQIEGVETSVTIRELAPGECKLSVRTDQGLNATRVCALLGGGGHASAAGCTVMGTVAEAKAAILAAIRQVWVEDRDGASAGT